MAETEVRGHRSHSKTGESIWVRGHKMHLNDEVHERHRRRLKEEAEVLEEEAEA